MCSLTWSARVLYKFSAICQVASAEESLVFISVIFSSATFKSLSRLTICTSDALIVWVKFKTYLTEVNPPTTIEATTGINIKFFF